MKIPRLLLACFGLLLLFFNFTTVVCADYIFEGSNFDDTIYYGVVRDTTGNLYLGIAYRLAGAIPDSVMVPMDNDFLFIYGYSGHDLIHAVEDTTIYGVALDALNLLTYSIVLLHGNTGNDRIIGTPHSDRIFGGSGDDYLDGGDGDDRIVGQSGNDFIHGGRDQDHLLGGPGNDCVKGYYGNDVLYGEGGDDFLEGGPGSDSLFGGSGNDFLNGDQQDDYLDGEQDNDILIGGTGFDYVNGSAGIDTFRCRSAVNRIIKYDEYPMDSSRTDCEDLTTPDNVEAMLSPDPYKDWAFMTEWGNGIMFHYKTTSSIDLLLQDRAEGAVILTGGKTNLPVTGDFDRDGRYDDVGILNLSTKTWSFDFNHNASYDTTVLWPGLEKTVHVVTGDFDNDGYGDDIAYICETERRWRQKRFIYNYWWSFDYDYNGSRDYTIHSWGEEGDLPVAGDFDRDGFVNDIAVYRPSNRNWYFNFNHNTVVDTVVVQWGNFGDIPFAGDFDYDDKNDDVGVFRPATRMWYFDYNRNGTTDAVCGPWGNNGDIPLTGDFKIASSHTVDDGEQPRDNDDIGLYRPNAMWHYDYNNDGNEDQVVGPWGTPIQPLCRTHKQYNQSSGPASLNMIMEHLGFTDHKVRKYYPRDIDEPTRPVPAARFSRFRTAVDIGYHLSMEHILYEDFSRKRELDSTWVYGDSSFMDPDGNLNINPGSKTGAYFQIKYNIGDVIFRPESDITSGNVQKWMQFCPSVGFAGQGKNDFGLSYIADKFSEGVNDSYVLYTALGEDGNFDNLNHLKAVIKGFIDHDIPLLVGGESGVHYNVLMGYWQRGKNFYIYMADPLDGLGQPFHKKAMRWKRMLLKEEALINGSKAFATLMIF
ncbi:MAG: calcium-binding protein, partial [candidate division Zixibacteria bacterium]|nr:calcium-binding protein [candidate division Zixibacteria bacterium]